MKIPNNVLNAREMRGIKRAEFAEMVGITLRALRTWEAGEVQIPYEKHVLMSELLGLPVAYLMGVATEQDIQRKASDPVTKSQLILMHGCAVYIDAPEYQYSAALVDSIKKELVFVDGASLAFDDIQHPLSTIPPAFSVSCMGRGEPLTIDGIMTAEAVFVEPISPDRQLCTELKGWYLPKDRFVVNETGTRFYYHQLGVKWLAFSTAT